MTASKLENILHVDIRLTNEIAKDYEISFLDVWINI